MIELAKREKCTGCMACAQICPSDCIKTEKDFLGNIYPKIDSQKCIECKACVGVCPELNELSKNKSTEAYAVWSLCEENRKSSASGGAAAEFYNYALDNGYYICGTEYTDDFRLIHTVSNDKKSIDAYKGSKYVFSELEQSYKEIKKLLLGGENLLFISLPCKISGLLQYLKKPYDNLITVDIICHGTPPHEHLKKHIEFCDKNGTSNKLRFRFDNEFVFALFKNNKDIYLKKGRQDEYLCAFLEGLNYRPNCYSCNYACPDRISDITIGDFWGIGAEKPFDHPYTGSISAVLINTQKGKEFFDKASKDRLFIEQRPVTEAIKGNAQLNYPTKMHEKRLDFENLYKEQGFEKAVQALLGNKIKEAKKENKKAKMRQILRKTAGIFIKRYR